MKQNQRKSRKNFHHRLEDFVSCLKQDIVTGKVKPNSYLPSELELGQQYSLSKNSIRKGLDQLVEDGLIEKIPRIGNRVRQPDHKGAVTIRFGYHSTNINEAKIFEIIEKFKQEYPHVNVQTLSLPYDSGEYYHTVLEYLDNGMLDVMTMNQSNFGYFARHRQEHKLGRLEPPSNVYPFLLEPYQSRQHLYALPFIFSPVILCYNPKHFEEADIAEPDGSWKWRNLIDAAKQLTVKKGTYQQYGFYFTPLALNRWLIFILQSGGVYRNTQGDLQFNCDRMMENLELCYNIIHHEGIFPHILAEKLSDAETLFLKEKVSMIITTYFQLNQLTDKGVPFDIAPLPRAHEAKTLLLSIGMAYNPNSAVSEAAKTFAEFSTSSTAQRFIRDHTLSLPSVKSIAEEGPVHNPNRPFRFNMYKEITSTFSTHLDTGLNTDSLNSISSELKLYLSGLEPPETFCEKLQAIIENQKQD